MRGESRYSASGVRHSKALVVRGGLTRTFGGLASFLAVIFFCSGIYILGDAFENPLTAQAAALLFGAFITALAAILFYFLLRPWKSTALAERRRMHRATSVADQPSPSEVSATMPRAGVREDLAYQRIYVDQTRIRR
jgi:hypothetical protein